MSTRFVNMFSPHRTYVSLTYWTGALNLWRVDRVGEDGTIDVTNVSDWRGLTHVNVPSESYRARSLYDSAALCREGLRLARREHRNMMRRTRQARADGTADGHAAGTWFPIESAEEARRVLAAMEDGTLYEIWETEYPQTYANRSTELWDAYVEAFDAAESAEIERAARYLAEDDSEEITR